MDRNVNGILGIDPGVSNGGFAFWRRTEPLVCYKMSNDEGKILRFLQHVKEVEPTTVVFIEGISIFGSDSDTPGKKYQIKKLTDHQSQLRAFCVAAKLPYVVVYPATWQSRLGLNKKKYKSKTEQKNAFKEYAQNAFPEWKHTLWSADATCIVLCSFNLYQHDRQFIEDRIQNRQQTKLL